MENIIHPVENTKNNNLNIEHLYNIKKRIFKPS